MKLITLDTSTEACSCALYIDGEITTQSKIAPRQHTSLILPMLDTLLNNAGLKPNQLDAIAFGRGPGSFIGLRIACSVTQAVAFATNIPVISISSLATLAQVAYIQLQAKKVLTALDARMGEVYWGKYKVDAEGIMCCDGEELVSKPENVTIPPSNNWYGVGTGWNSYTEILVNQLKEKLDNYQGKIYPQADAMIPLALSALKTGNTVIAKDALPIYLRNNVVQKQK
ncbi:MAG: tRNA (adenosine(37)-N6)-threonylcarbamoyltransferase complex dimerization subunit type 1 TsaB [Thiomargarita sp.]|nr:tRNA (adenosine(37)-N6)-threonylcarbamoyltransferase complex dimerization subunit type 1 TsaB [Thiomargarita sp.]